MRAFQTALLGLLLFAAASAQAQDAAPLDRKLVEQHVYNSLKTVINYGADLYNNRDAAGCYHVFRTACVTTEPLLDHRPDLQKAIRDAMSEAEKNPDMARRSWVLRRALDQVRAGIKPGAAAKVEDKKVEPKKVEEPKKEEPKKEEEKKEIALWQRLGGEPAVKKVIDDWFELAANDPKVNLTRGGTFQPTPDQVDTLKKHLVAQISAASGGPLKYTGRDMKTAHKGMAITDAEFDAAGANLIKALEANKVPADEIKDLLRIIESTRKDIVEKP